MPPFYFMTVGLIKFLLGLLTRWQVKGLENLPKEGPVILVANHQHYADIPLLGASLPRHIAFMAKEELFRSKIRLLVRAWGAFPVRRGGVDRAGLRQAIQLLRQGKVLGVFPEGTRSPSGRLQAARPGVALIAYHSQAALLPVGITGTKAISGGFWWLRRPCLTVNIGPLFTLGHPPRVSGLDKETMASLTDSIMGRVAQLLPPDYRGVYGGEKKAQPTAVPSVGDKGAS